MVTNDVRFNYASALENFQSARRKATLEQLLAYVRGESTQLLSYEEVRKALRAASQIERGVQDIPLDAIVGSVGRYADFTRSFLPRHDGDAERWARVRIAVTSMEGVPPIYVYKLGDAYFVRDGNHRVSIARELGATHIQAYVTEVQTKVPLTPDIRPDDLIIKAEYADFLERTWLDEQRPDADLSVTVPGKYQILEEHIQVHRYYMGQEQHREITLPEATAHWYDTVYLPMIETMNRLGILRDFPERTETDLYLWLCEHSESLKQWLGWDLELEAVAEDLAERFSTKAAHWIVRMGEKLLNVLTPDEFEAGPPPGEWRERRMARRNQDALFHDIIVALNGQESGWLALDQAIEIARREQGQVLGLHVVPTEAHKETKLALDVEWIFAQRCAEAGVEGHLTLATGEVGEEIAARARWADLIVASLEFPPGSDPLARLNSGFYALIQRAPVPVLTVPAPMFPLHNVLLAYDSSPKSQEALFLATYLAARWPEMHLVIVSGHANGSAAEDVLAPARDYLESHDIQATYIEREGDPATVIVETATEYDSRLIVMGGYGHNPVLYAVLGSTVDEVLRYSRRPVLLCR